MFIPFNPALVEAAKAVLAVALEMPKMDSGKSKTFDSRFTGVDLVRHTCRSSESCRSSRPNHARRAFSPRFCPKHRVLRSWWMAGSSPTPNATRRWPSACRKSFLRPKVLCAKSRARWRKARSNAPRPNFRSLLPLSRSRLPMKMEKGRKFHERSAESILDLRAHH